MDKRVIPEEGKIFGKGRHVAGFGTFARLEFNGGALYMPPADVFALKP